MHGELGGSGFVKGYTRELKRGNDQVQQNSSTSTPAHTAPQIKTTSESRQEEGLSKTKQERICTLHLLTSRPSHVEPYHRAFRCCLQQEKDGIINLEMFFTLLQVLKSPIMLR